jgi:hypothetical protein
MHPTETEKITPALSLDEMGASEPPSSDTQAPNHPRDGGDPVPTVRMDVRGQTRERGAHRASGSAEGIGQDERRDSPRIALSAQVVVVWRDAAQMAETHTILDYGLGGFRLRADRTVPVGRIGRAVNMLPERVAVDLDVLVVWSAVRPDRQCDFGVRFLGS